MRADRPRLLGAVARNLICAHCVSKSRRMAVSRLGMLVQSGAIEADQHGIQGTVFADSIAVRRPISPEKPSMDPRLKRRERRIWEIVSHSPLESLWNLQGTPLRGVAART